MPGFSEEVFRFEKLDNYSFQKIGGAHVEKQGALRFVDICPQNNYAICFPFFICLDYSLVYSIQLEIRSSSGFEEELPTSFK